MTLTPVKSSMLSGIDYDPDSLTLFVQFHPSKKQAVGDLWAYKNVIPERWAEMQAAESVGKWFLANVKGKYDGKKVEAPLTVAEIAQGLDEHKGGATVYEDTRTAEPDDDLLDSEDNWGDGPIDGNS